MDKSFKPVRTTISSILPGVFFLIVMVLPGLSESSYAQGSRQKINFNHDWRFYKGDVENGQAVDFKDNQWRTLNLPHDWSIEGPFNEKWASATGYLPGGIGWYRKTFNLSKSMENKHVFIYFDGVYKNSEVWINGHFLGNRPNGFIAFEYELTPYLHRNGENVIAVRVDHSQFADSRWYTGSGINRNVYLIAENPVHVSQWGVAFTTPKVSKENASARVAVSLQNQSDITKKVTVKVGLQNAEGKVVSSAQNKVALSKKGSGKTLISLNIKSPFIWSVDHPYLYQLKVQVYVDGKETDDYDDEVGIRTFRFDADKGFFLNGENLKIKGVCLHDDAGALGTAVPAEVWERRLMTLKEGGVNAIRMSHNPHADYFYKLADQLGFLVMDEAFDEWETGKNKWISGWNVGVPGKDGYHEYFKEWADRDLRDMILRNRNRPSIIMWSIGNEIDYPNDPYSDSILNTGRNPQIYGKGFLPDHPPASRLAEISKKLVAVAKAADTSRPITAALAGVVMSNTTDYPENLDIVGYNYQEYRYQEDHEKYPKRVIYGSENGMSLASWKDVSENPFISAQFLWTGVDYLGEAGRWPTRSSGPGLLDLAGNPKPLYYFRKSLWTAKPMISLAVTPISKDTLHKRRNYQRMQASWNFNEDEEVRVTGFTNCATAELFLNGKSLGRKDQNADRIIFWDINYEPGTLVAKGYEQGKTSVADTLQTSGKAAAINAHIYVSPFYKKPGMTQIEIQLTDDKDIPVVNDDREIAVSISGPAILAGLESGSNTSHEDYKSNKRKTLNGKLLLFVNSKQKVGKVKITLTSDNLLTKTIEYEN